ncbi:MAG: hypothetical protein AAFV19_01255 [Pseudomonadota bacterium]
MSGLRTVMDELRTQLPAIGAWFGAFVSGPNAGNLALIHLYRELNDVEPAFGVYGASGAFAALATTGNIGLRERNLIRLDDGAKPFDVPSAGYQSFSRYPAVVLRPDTHESISHALSAEGTAYSQCGTFWTGRNAGQRLLTVVCPDTDAMNDAHGAIAARDALLANPIERDVLHILGGPGR